MWVGERADALLDRLALRVCHRPLRVGNGIAAGARNELECDLGGGVGDRRLGELAGLHRHVGADDGVGVAVGADDIVDAGIEAHTMPGRTVLVTFMRCPYWSRSSE